MSDQKKDPPEVLDSIEMQDTPQTRRGGLGAPTAAQGATLDTNRARESIALPPIKQGVLVNVDNVDLPATVKDSAHRDLEHEDVQDIISQEKNAHENLKEMHGTFAEEQAAENAELQENLRKRKEDKERSLNTPSMALEDASAKMQNRTKQSVLGMMLENENKEESEDETSEEYREKHPAWFNAHGKWEKFAPKSLFFMTKENCLRRLMVYIYLHPCFDSFIIFLILVNSLLLGIFVYDDPHNLTWQNKAVTASEPVFVIAFTAECVIKVIAMGFCIDEGSYLTHGWNWLDFLVVISSLLTEIPQMKSVSGVRTFRLMRPLRSLTTMPSMRVLISTLLSSVAQLGGVMVLAIFFFTIFAILGVSLWKGDVNMRCRYTDAPVNGTWPIDNSDTRLCNDKERHCGANRYCGSLIKESQKPGFKLAKGVNPFNDNKIEDLNFGFSSFDNVPVAFITIFQVITLEGWIDILNIYQDVFTYGAVVFYFLMCVVVCSMFVLNLTIAVMLIAFMDENDENEDNTDNSELVEQGEQIGLPFKLIDFLIEQDNLQISEKNLKNLKAKEQQSNQASLWEQLTESEVKPNTDHWYYQSAVTRWFFYLVNSPIFGGFITFVIVLNTIVLAVNKYPDWSTTDPEFANILKETNTAFTIIFSAEVLLKLFGLGVYGYISDRMNVFDCVIVVIAMVELINDKTNPSSDGGGGGPFGALRAVRLFRIFKIFRSGDLRMLLESIILTVAGIKDYIILLLLFIYVWALLGMSFFANKVKFNDEGEVDLKNGTPPRTNFDKNYFAFLAVFQIIIGENWNSVMYNHMLAGGEVACLFFIGLVITGNIIMLNLFLAILLGNFERAKQAFDKAKIFTAFEQYLKSGVEINVAIIYLFDDEQFARYIEEKVLRKEKTEHLEDSKLSDDLGQMSEDADDEEIEVTEWEINQIFQAIEMGTLELIITGEVEMTTMQKTEEVQMTELQRKKCIEIAKYVKRLYIRRKKEIELQKRIKEEEEKAVDEFVEAAAKQEEVDQLDDIVQQVENETASMSCVERIWHHLENSSLFVFPINSTIRQACLQCITNEDELKREEDEAFGKVQEDDPFAQVSSNPIEPNKVAVEPATAPLDLKPSKFAAKSVKVPGSKPLNSNQSSMMVQQVAPLSQSVKIPAKITKKTVKKVNIVAKTFDAVIMLLILISSLTLVMDGPLSNPNSSFIVNVGYLDNVFTVLFTIEATVKIIALGFIFNSPKLSSRGYEPYIRNPWNIIDFVVVIASLFDFVVTIQISMDASANKGGKQNANIQSSLQSLKALRALRALRPLRMISKDPGMKVIVNALIQSVPSIGNVAIVCLLFLLIFAIMGVDFFKGNFHRCSEGEYPQIKTKADCLKIPGASWTNRDENFDNVGNAMMTLIEMMTTEGWVDNMHDGVDGVDPDMQPIKNNNFVYTLFFVAFMIVGSQFILNLFVGVVMENFNRLKEQSDMGAAFVTDDQRSWIAAHKLGLQVPLIKKMEPPEGWRGNLFYIVNHDYFEAFIMFFILLNTVVMATNYEGIDAMLVEIFGKFNIFFAVIFNIEMVMKLLGLGCQYFDSAWNCFDMFVVILTDGGFVLQAFITGSAISSAATVVRAFRIMRIIRLVRSQEEIKVIFDTILIILPQITNFLTLMLLLLFIFAALGMNQYGGMVYGDFLTVKNNFENVGSAILYLFRASTGEDWNKIMWEISKTEGPDCISDQDYITYQRNEYIPHSCGNGTFAFVYFMLFLCVVTWLVINLAVSAVIDGFEASKKLNSGKIKQDEILDMVTLWQDFDPKATGWINMFDFICLIIELPKPFGNPNLKNLCQYQEEEFDQAYDNLFNKSSYYINGDRRIIIKHRDILKILSQYKLNIYEGKPNLLHFKDVYYNLIKKAFREDDEDFKAQENLKTKIVDEWESLFKTKGFIKTGFKSHQAFATMLIQKHALKRFRYKDEPDDQPHPDQYAHHGSRVKRNKAHGESQEALISPGNRKGLPTEEDDSLQVVPSSFDNKMSGTGNTVMPRLISEQPDDGTLPLINNRFRPKDENPQEFEEVGSQEEQSGEGRQPVVNGTPPRSNVGDDQLQFNVEMGVSIGSEGRLSERNPALEPSVEVPQAERPQTSEQTANK